MKQILVLFKRAKVRLSGIWREWLAERRLEKDRGEVRRRYAPMLAEAKRNKDHDKYQEILADQGIDLDLILEPVLYRRMGRLTRKARRWLVALPPMPSPDEYENEFWRQAQTAEFYYLKVEAELGIRRAVRKEWLQSCSFWINFLFGFLGLLIGLVSVWRK